MKNAVISAVVCVSLASFGACATVTPSGTDANVKPVPSVSEELDTLRTRVRALEAQAARMQQEIEELRREFLNLRTEFSARITSTEGLVYSVPISFPFNSATIPESEIVEVERLARTLQNFHQGSLVAVRGYADGAGSQKYNRALSLRRAEAVKAYLISEGLSRELIRTVAGGEAEQIVPGATKNAKGAELNRRVVVSIETKGGFTVP